ncbi:MAG: ABC transporter permease [Bryobacteraceae bacterium]
MNVPGRLFLTNIIERRALLYQMVRRDFEQRYVGSAGGWLWGLIHPLAILLCWKFVFEICMKIQLPRGEVTQNYTLFLLAGYLPWTLFQDTVLRSATSLVDQANLITKTVFPAELIPIAIFFSSLVNHLLTLFLVLGAAWLWLGQASVMTLSLPIYMILTGLLGVGIGWIVASLQVYVRDTAQVMTVVLTIWFWLTPIFIYEESYPSRFHFLLDYNPLAYLVRAYREHLLGPLPDLRQLALVGEEIGVIAFYALAAFIAGGLFFRQLKRGFADVL